MARSRTRSLSAATVVALTLATVGLTAGPAAAAGKPTCLGKKATKVLTKSGKTLKGTKGNDVLVATGSKDTVLGLGGNDRICVTKAGSKVDGGAGNDSISVVSGKVTGGTGDDSISMSKPTSGSVIDGGDGMDKITAPAASMKGVSVPVTSGDSFDGLRQHVEQPATGGPTFGLSVAGTQLGGPAVGVPLAAAISNDPASGNFQGSMSLTVADLALAAGRTPASWSIDFGDGGPVQAGAGAPPSVRGHTYLLPGSHTISVKVTDSLGDATVRTGVVNARPDGSSSFSTGAPVLTGLHATVNVTVTDPVGFAGVRSWAYTWGDGAESSGQGAPPLSFSHDYAAEGHYWYGLSYELANGQFTGFTQGQLNTGSAPARSLTYNVTSPDFRQGVSALHVPVGTTDTLGMYVPGVDSVTVTAGDGSAPQTITPASDHRAFASLQWNRTGTFTIGIAAHTASQPDLVASLTARVYAAPAAPVVSGPSFVTEGPVTVKVTGTVPAGASVGRLDSELGDDVAVPGALPGQVTTVVHAGTRTLGVGLSNQPHDGDGTTEGFLQNSRLSVTAVPLGSRVDAAKLGATAGWSAVAVGAPTELGVTSWAGLGTSISATTVDWGDGQTSTFAGRADGISPSPFTHTWTSAGDRVVTVTVTDSKGGKAQSSTVASVVGPVTLNAPATATGNAAPALTTIPGVSAAAATGAALLSWSVNWGDSSPTLTGYGPLPALVHAFVAGTHAVSVTVWDDHGQKASRSVSVTTV